MVSLQVLCCLRVLLVRFVVSNYRVHNSYRSYLYLAASWGGPVTCACGFTLQVHPSLFQSVDSSARCRLWSNRGTTSSVFEVNLHCAGFGRKYAHAISTVHFCRQQPLPFLHVRALVCVYVCVCVRV